MQPEEQKPIPRQIGPYVLDRELGRGAFGIVYAGYHSRHPEHRLAIKILENRGNIDRLMIEPALLSQLDHPCIVGLEDYFLHSDRLILVMTFRGENLQTLLDRGETFTPTEVRQLLLQLGSALEHTHRLNIVHRDIKPSNILVDHSQEQRRCERSERNFVLTAFGNGRMMVGIQAQKFMGGTYLYMAPEQLRGRPTPQSDLWALGAVAYRMLTGKHPFAGSNLEELADQIFRIFPEPLRDCAPGVDANLEGAITQLLEKSVQLRTPTAAQLLRDLGDTEETTIPGRSENTTPNRVPPSPALLDRQIDRRIRLLSGISLALILMSLTIVSGSLLGLLLLTGGALFFFSQQNRGTRTRRVLLLVGSLLLFSLATGVLWFLFHSGVQTSFRSLESTSWQFWWLNTLSMTLPDVMLNEPPGSRRSIIVSSLVIFLIWVFAVPLCLVPLRRQLRLRAFRRAMRACATDVDRSLEVMKDYLNVRFEDVSFHLKYAEALLTRGLFKEVVVETRLLLQQDPYNFQGHLMLANAYLEVGLPQECLAVCDHYLKVAGQCFEFAELKQQSEAMLGIPS